MNKMIPVLSTFSKIVKMAENTLSRTKVVSMRFDSGLEILNAVRVPKLARKKDYLAILIQLRKLGYSIKAAADACGISYSYAVKLLQKK